MMITIPKWKYYLVRMLPFLCKHWDTINVGDDEHNAVACIDCQKREYD